MVNHYVSTWIMMFWETITIWMILVDLISVILLVICIDIDLLFLQLNQRGATYWLNSRIFYSLIFMRPIYYFDTWAIIWHSIVCWFIVFPPFLPVLVCCNHKIVLHWYEKQNKDNFTIMLRANHHKSWEIVRNQLSISCQIVANVLKL